jgi:hypothetical protein
LQLLLFQLISIGMDENLLRETIIGEYRRRYPTWTGLRVTDLVPFFGGHLAVVHADMPQQPENEEMCFVDPKIGVRIFSTTEELAQFLEGKTNGPALESWRRKINVLIAVVAIAAIALLIFAAWQNRFDPVMTSIVLKNFAAIVGLPFAFVAAFVVVALFRQGEAPMDFEGAGLKLKGAAGEIVLWLLCFAVISGAIAALWTK